MIELHRFMFKMNSLFNLCCTHLLGSFPGVDTRAIHCHHVFVTLHLFLQDWSSNRARSTLRLLTALSIFRKPLLIPVMQLVRLVFFFVHIIVGSSFFLADEDVSLLLDYEGQQEYILCHLDKTHKQESLDLNFQMGDSISLFSHGQASVHLSG